MLPSSLAPRNEANTPASVENAVVVDDLPLVRVIRVLGPVCEQLLVALWSLLGWPVFSIGTDPEGEELSEVAQKDTSA